MTDPGHPCEMIAGRAFAWRERTWMKWMSSPSIVVTNCGRLFSLAATFLQS